MHATFQEANFPASCYPRQMTDTNVTDSFVHAPGGKLFARRWTLATPTALSPIIVFHDSLGSVDLWRDFPAKLAQATGREVIAYDRLGFGRSDPHPGHLAPDFIKDEGRTGLPAVRKAFGIDRMVLFGHSVGGGMAISAGSIFADETDGIITLSAQAFLEDRTVAGIEQARAGFQSEEQIARLAKYHGQKAKWVLDAWTETWLAPSFSDWSLDKDLAVLRSPLLTIHGEQDEYGSKAHPDRIKACSGAPVKVVMIENGGHLPHKEQPELVLELIGEFASSLPQRA